VTKQSLNCLYVFALVDKEGREAVAEVVKAELLSRLKADADLNRGWANFILCLRACAQRCFALHLCGRENPILRLRLQPLPCATSLSLRQKCSYTTGMKTAVSIPEDVFKGAERLARKTKRSRSRLFSDALKEYLARHTPDSVTEAMNKACSELGAAKDEFVSSAARRVLERSEW
jgi:predicted transcriptional regulator